MKKLIKSLVCLATLLITCFFVQTSNALEWVQDEPWHGRDVFQSDGGFSDSPFWWRLTNPIVMRGAEGGDIRYTFSSENEFQYAEWRFPQTPAGRYQVWAHMPEVFGSFDADPDTLTVDDFSPTNSAHYNIYNRTSLIATRTKNQASTVNEGPEKWILLGEWAFTDEPRVRLSDKTSDHGQGCSTLSKCKAVIYDAVKLVGEDPPLGDFALGVTNSDCAGIDGSPRIRLAWQASENAGSYQLYRNVRWSHGTNYLNIPDGNRFYNNAGNLQPNTTYQYRVRAFAVSSGETKDSQTVSETTGSCVSESPDLIVDNPNLLPVNVQVGESFNIAGIVKNQGDASASSTTLDYYRSTQPGISTSDEFLSSDSVPTLSANSSVTRSNSASINTQGTFYVRSCVRPVSGETDINNNCSAYTTIVVTNSAPTTFQISATRPVNGTITASSGSLFCGTNCSESYSQGSSVTLNAITETSGYEFSSWTGDCASFNTSSCTLTVSSNKAVGAVFVQTTTPKDELAVQLNGDAIGSQVISSPAGIACRSVCRAEFAPGSSITLTASTGANQTFDGWGPGCQSQAATTCIVQLNGDTQITANYSNNSGPQLTVVDAPTFAVAGQPYTIRLRANDSDGSVTRIDWDTNGSGSQPVSKAASNNQTLSFDTVYSQALKNTNVVWTATAYDNNGIGGNLVSRTVPVVCANGDFGTFVRDVTLADTFDNTPFVSPGSTFVKKWEIKNCGTNAWTSSYRLKFIRGSRMEAPRSVALESVVNPGERVVISVPMRAPAQAGTHQGFWQLTNAAGVVFPTSQANQIWVKIQTGQPGKASVDSENIQKNAENVGQCTAANPISTATGAQLREHQLLKVNGVVPIVFSINYNSLVLEEGPLGIGWTHNYALNAKLRSAKETDDSESADDLIVEWSGNQLNDYRMMDGEPDKFKSPQVARQFDQLERNEDGSYQLATRSRQNFVFDPIDENNAEVTTPGFLSEIQDAKSRSVQMSYNTDGMLAKVEDPIGGVWLNYEYNDLALLSKVSDSLGREVSFSYDDSRRLVRIVNALGITHFYAYNNLGQTLAHTDSSGVNYFTNLHDNDGHVVSQDDALNSNLPYRWAFDETSDPEKIITTVTDRLGNAETFEFNKVYQLLKTTDKEGNKLSNTYNQQGLLSEVIDSENRKTLMSYDAMGNLASVTDPDGNTRSMTYDANRNVLTQTDALNQLTQYSYDESNNLLTRQDPDNSVTRFVYNENNQLLKTTSPTGFETIYTYHSGRVATKTDPSGNQWSYGYDNAGRLVQSTDPDGHITKFTLDALDRVIVVEDGLGRQTLTSYDSRGNVLSETDPNGNVTRRQYDGNANLVKEIDALNQETSYQYDGENRLTLVSDARGFTNQFEYDKLGRLTSITDGLANIRRMEYDSVGNLTKRIDAKGNAESVFDYDNRDNLISTIDALNRASRSNYDAINRVVQDIDPLNRITEYRYDLLSRLITVIDALNGQSGQTFDLDGYRTSFTDPNDNATTETRDEIGRLTDQVTASGSRTQTEYNGRGLVTKTTNGRGQIRSLSYDAAGRLTSATDPDGLIEYSYDSNGNLLQVTEGESVIIRSYDVLNRVSSYQNARGEVITYTYDMVGNLSQLGYPGGKRVDYTYDGNNRLASVNDWQNRLTRYQYDDNGRMTKTIRPNGTVLQKTYDIAGQLSSQLDLDSDGNVIYQVDYRYDDVGNIIEENAQPSLDPQRTIDLIMEYQAGNVLERASADDSSLQATTVDADDNLTQLVLASETMDLQYDSRNRMVNGGGVQSFYDAENHRVGLTRAGLDTHYMVNPEAVLSQLLIASSDNQQTFYLYGDGLQLQETATQTLYYHYDYRGSTVALTDKNGKVVDRFAYLPFGGVIAQFQGNTKTPFLYNGRDGVMDDDNGLYHMRARFYSPEIRRFVNRDVLLGEVNSGGSLNRFAYVNGRPTLFVDPSGNIPLLIPVGLAIYSGVSAAWAAYDVYATLSDDCLTNEEKTKRIGIDASIGLIAGGAGKAAHKTYKLVKKGTPSTREIATQPVGPSARTPVGRSGQQNNFINANAPKPRNNPETINGRDFSGHAIDRMQEGGFTPSIIENALRTGTRSAGNTPSTSVFTDSVNKLRVVTNSTTGNIITIIPGAK